MRIPENPDDLLNIEGNYLIIQSHLADLAEEEGHSLGLVWFSK